MTKSCNLFVAGISHKTSPIEIREKFYLKPAERELLLSEFKSDPRIIEAILVSTCNRTEIYAHLLDGCPPEILFTRLLDVKRINDHAAWRKYFYIQRDTAAVEHFFRVTGGLDSLVLGEKQILGQVKEAVALSREKGMLSRTFNILSHLAIRSGKKAQHETEIGQGGSSVSWAAIALTQKILGTLDGKSFLIIGTGKMGKLATCYLHKKQPVAIYLMNRTEDKAEVLAHQLGAQAVSFWKIKEVLSAVDVCICASGAPHYVIETDLVAEVMNKRKFRPLIFMDMSIPRNIHPEVSAVAGVRLFTIDDLKGIVQENSQKRQEAVRQVEQIVADKISEFYRKLSAVPVIPESALAQAELLIKVL